MRSFAPLRSRRRLATSAFVTLSGALLVGGCGNDDRAPEQRQVPTGESRVVRAVADDYFRAVKAADGRRICAFYTDELRRYVARLQQASCPSAMRAEAQALPEALSGYRIRRIEIDGDRARVYVGGGMAGEDRIGLRRESGSWKIRSAPGVGS